MADIFEDAEKPGLLSTEISLEIKPQ